MMTKKNSTSYDLTWRCKLKRNSSIVSTTLIHCIFKARTCTVVYLLKENCAAHSEELGLQRVVVISKETWRFANDCFSCVKRLRHRLNDKLSKITESYYDYEEFLLRYEERTRWKDGTENTGGETKRIIDNVKINELNEWSEEHGDRLRKASLSRRERKTLVNSHNVYVYVVSNALRIHMNVIKQRHDVPQHGTIN